MRITDNLYVGLFWVDIRKDGRWNWYGVDIVRPLRLRLQELRSMLFPVKPHPFLAKCPAFGRYYTSGGGDRAQGCTVRFGERCRISPQTEAECEQITKMDWQARRKVLGTA